MAINLKESGEAPEIIKTQLKNALELAHLGLWGYDIAEDIFSFNDAFYSIFKTSVKEMGGYRISSAEYAKRFVYPDDMALVGVEIENAVKTDDPHYTRQFEHRIVYADGGIGFMAVRFFIIKDDSGRTIKSYGINQDITAIKEREDNLKKIQTEMELRIKELKHFNEMMVDRELKMIELKERIKQLEGQLKKK